MHNPPKPKSTNAEQSTRFKNAMRKILSVPKSEMDRREAEYQKERAAKVAARQSKLKAWIIFVISCAALSSARANPAERAQMLKAHLMESFVLDGWQLVSETPSMIVVEKPLAGSGRFIFQALTTGANGTPPVFRLSLPVVPVSDHESRVPWVITMNSQNAFGQMTSIPNTNKQIQQYILNKIKYASDSMPAKYKLNLRH